MDTDASTVNIAPPLAPEGTKVKTSFPQRLRVTIAIPSPPTAAFCSNKTFSTCREPIPTKEIAPPNPGEGGSIEPLQEYPLATLPAKVQLVTETERSSSFCRVELMEIAPPKANPSWLVAKLLLKLEDVMFTSTSPLHEYS